MFSHKVETVILCLILIYAMIVIIQIMFEEDSDQISTPILVIEIIILVVFMIEIALKILAMGIVYLKDWWNIFDIIVVLACFIFAILELAVPSLEGNTFMRFRAILRLLRILIMFRKFNEYRQIREKRKLQKFMKMFQSPVEKACEILGNLKQQE